MHNVTWLSLVVFRSLSLAALLTPFAASADPVLDQAHVPASFTTSSLISGTIIQAQTFTVGVTGTLVQLDVFGTGGNSNLYLDIRGTNGSQPSDVDFRQTVNVGAFSSSGSTSITLDTPVAAGDFLSFVFYFVGAGKANLSGFNSSSIDPYTGGSLWTSGNPVVAGGGWYPNANNPSQNFDLAFRTFVETGASALISDLVAGVLDLNLQQGIANSLDAKINSALAALDDVNENNDVAAINKLQAFINAVEAQRGINISDAEATELIMAAQNIIDILVG